MRAYEEMKQILGRNRSHKRGEMVPDTNGCHYELTRGRLREQAPLESSAGRFAGKARVRL